MVQAKRDIRKHLILAAAAVFLQAAAYAITIALPANKGIAILTPLLLPGTLLQFFVGGGMSLIDGLAPQWRSDIAFALGFLLNAVLMYGYCLVTAKVTKVIRSELQAH